MDQGSEIGHARGDGQRMPGRVRHAVLAGVGIVLAGALYLVAVRGEALLVDLSAFSQRIFCF
jgi:hypothetical protein